MAEIITTNTCEGDLVEFHIPSSKKEITLSQLLEKIKLEDELGQLESELLELEMYLSFGDKNGEAYTEEDFNIDSALKQQQIFLLYADMLKIFLPEPQHEYLYKIPYAELGILSGHIMKGYEEDQGEVEPEFSFVSHEICSIDIEKYKEELKSLSRLYDWKKVRDIKKRIKVLKRGVVMAVPARQVMLKTRIVTDKIQENYPKMSEDLQKSLDVKSEDMTHEELVKLYKDIKGTEFKSLKEFKSLNDQSRAIARYFKKYEEGYYESASKLLSHICVPITEDYDYKMAEARSDKFNSLTLDVVDSLLAFFLLMRDSLTASMGSSLALQKKLLQMSLDGLQDLGDG